VVKCSSTCARACVCVCVHERLLGCVYCDCKVAVMNLSCWVATDSDVRGWVRGDNGGGWRAREKVLLWKSGDDVMMR